MFNRIFQSNKSYIFGVVDDIVEEYKFLSKEGQSSSLEKYEFICEKRNRVQGKISIRADVNKREILDFIHDKNSKNQEPIELEEFILLIISKEKFGLNLLPETNQSIHERLAHHQIF